MEVLMIRLVLCGALTVFTCLFASHEKKDPIPLFDSVLLAKATTAAVGHISNKRCRNIRNTKLHYSRDSSFYWQPDNHTTYEHL